MSDAPQELWKLLESYVAEERLELDDVEIVGAHGGGKSLRVTIDGDQVGTDRLGALARGISRLLDQHDLIPGSYQLEVSSPGLERKLRRPEHWKKSIGRDAKVKTSVEVDGSRRHEGIIKSADSDSCVVEVDGAERNIPYAVVISAKTLYKWKTPVKPGKK